MDFCDVHSAMTSVAQMTLDAPAFVPFDPDRKPAARRTADKQRIVCPFCDGKFVVGAAIARHVKAAHPEHFQKNIDWGGVSATSDGKAWFTND
jgi:hypothetical protein